jgi:hypothetical protein
MSSGVLPLQAIAVLIRKFGKRIPNGGFEVEVSHQELKDLSQYGMLNEVPELDRHVLRWQYYPNNTIEGELVTPESVTPTGELPESKDE